MDRRSFFKLGAACLGTAAARPAPAFVPAHNWDGYDWGTAPPVGDRLYQGPFPQYPPEEVLPGSEVVMATTPSDPVVPDFGMGLVTYVTGDFGGNTFRGLDMEKAIEAFAQVPMGQKLYVRPTWRELQKRPGRLDPDAYWKTIFAVAKQYGKRVGFRVMMSDPDIAEPALPDFVLDKVPMVRLRGGEWKRGPAGHQGYGAALRPSILPGRVPRAERTPGRGVDGNPLVEYMDTFMYGFWGEGHTWPFTDHPFPDAATAERTFVRMFETQLEYWKNTPLVTNTQPDWSRVGNSELIDRTIRSHNWLRTDTIFVENEQIEAIANRPPWVAAVLEVGMADGSPESLGSTRASPTPTTSSPTSWTWAPTTGRCGTGTPKKAENVMRYYRRYPEMIDTIGRRVGYRVRPSLVWRYAGDDRSGLVIGFANDGIAGVPGVLRVERESDDGRSGRGRLDPGYPLPGKIRQAGSHCRRGRTGRGSGCAPSSR